jgi:HSP20 family molecular chaperone IbpA
MTTRSDELQQQNRTPEQAQARQGDRVWVTPPVDLLESSEEYLVVADMPGLSRDEVRIEYEDGELRLSGEGITSYRRTFRIGDGVDVEKVAAELKDGVLEIHLPKAERTKPKLIPIKTS